MSLILAIDNGNTRTKLGLFREDGSMIRHGVALSQEAKELALSWLEEYRGVAITAGWISTSVAWDSSGWEELNGQNNVSMIQITAAISWPFAHQYETPHTLGADRFAAIVAACNLCQAKPVLVIDAGTAITYDVAALGPTYLGGAISPGINMRYQALHQFTARLPLIKRSDTAPLIGNSTINSLKAGVHTAVVKEVQGMIEAYKEHIGDDLQVFLTGGDSDYFEKQLKSVNFADALLVLRGIYFIIKHIAST
ncbi:MAG: type III pantothenate kinase [Bacteroidia bacterium]|nr:type III pantothenate kinase [Bacteroidia bacterium]